jgi:ABC-type antimicrobial peptide transport system permease subunit
MVIGARPSDVLVQFLVESVVLSLLGGLIGVALGYGGSWPAAIAPATRMAAGVFRWDQERPNETRTPTTVRNKQVGGNGFC